MSSLVHALLLAVIVLGASACGKEGRPRPWPDPVQRGEVPRLSIIKQTEDALEVELQFASDVAGRVVLQCMDLSHAVLEPDEPDPSWQACGPGMGDVQPDGEGLARLEIQGWQAGQRQSLSVLATDADGDELRSEPMTWTYLAVPNVPNWTYAVDDTGTTIVFADIPAGHTIQFSFAMDVGASHNKTVAAPAQQYMRLIERLDADVVEAQVLAGPAGTVKSETKVGQRVQAIATYYPSPASTAAAAVSATEATAMTPFVPMIDEALPSPEPINVIRTSDKKVTVFWAAVEGAVAYDAYVGSDADALVVSLALGINPLSLSYDAEIEAKTTHIGVRAVMSDGRVSPFAVAKIPPMQ